MDDDIVYVDTVEEFEKQSYLNKIVLAPWGGEIEDEEKIKKFNNYRPRCVKDDTTKEELENKKCFLTGKKAFQLVYFARAY
jgi:prolyl-tRNA synthetase